MSVLSEFFKRGRTTINLNDADKDLDDTEQAYLFLEIGGASTAQRNVGFTPKDGVLWFVRNLGSQSIVARPKGGGGSVTISAQKGSFVYGDGANLKEFPFGSTAAQTLNVKTDFGAAGDGSTDDTTAVQAAFASGAHVVFPAGTYIVSATIPASSNLEIDGEPGAILQAKAGSNFNAMITGTGLSNIIIRNFVLDVNGPNRTGNTVTRDGFRLVSVTDMLFDRVTVKNTRGTNSADPGAPPTASAVAYAMSLGTRITYIDCFAIDCGVSGRISDGWYSNGSKIIFTGCVAQHCQDTGFVFENASESGGTNLRIDGQGTGSGLAIGVAGNTDVADNFFEDVIIKDVIVPIEFGLFGPNTNTGKVKNTSFKNIQVDSAGSTFPALFFYPNPQVNPGALVYSGRIVGVTIDGLDILANAVDQYGIYVTTADDVAIRNCRGSPSDAFVDVESGCTKLVIEENDVNIGNAGVFGIIVRDGCDDVVVARNRIRGGAGMVHGIYFFGTTTNVRTPDNIISGASLGDQEGIGADTTTAPRSAKDVVRRTAVPASSALGLWPLGTFIVDVSGGTAGRLGWQVTTAGVAGSGAVFTEVRSPTKDTNGATFALSLGIGGASSANNVLKAYAAGAAICVQRSGAGKAAIVFDDVGNYGFIDYDTVAANGVRISALNLGALQLGTNDNNGYGTSAFTPCIRVTNVGAYMGPSVVTPTARVHIEAQTTGAGTAPIKLGNGGSFMTTPEDGALEYSGSLTFTKIVSSNPTRLTISMTLPTNTVDPNTAGSIAGGAEATLTATVTGAAVGDFASVALDGNGTDPGFVIASVYVSATNTVAVRIRNVTAGALTHASRTWKVTVRK